MDWPKNTRPEEWGEDEVSAEVDTERSWSGDNAWSAELGKAEGKAHAVPTGEEVWVIACGLRTPASSEGGAKKAP